MWAQEGAGRCRQQASGGDEGAVSPQPLPRLDPSLHLGGRRENGVGLLPRGRRDEGRKMRSWGKRTSLVYNHPQPETLGSRMHRPADGQPWAEGPGGASVVSQRASLDSKEVTRVTCEQQAVRASAARPSGP